MKHSRVRQFSSLAGLTAVEILRQPLCILLTASCVLFISLLPLLITHTLGEGAKLVRDSSLAVVFTGGLLLSAYAACSTFAHEIRRGTAAAILSKPVGRTLFFLSKFSGVAVVMVSFCACTLLATTMATRMASLPYRFDWWVGFPLLVCVPLAFLGAGLLNFFTRRPFSSSAFGLMAALLAIAFAGAGFIDAEGMFSSFGSAYFWPLLPAGLLITMATLVLSGVAVSLATRLDVVPTVAVCGLLLFSGLVSDYLFGRHADTSLAAGLLHAMLPNWQHFWVVDALSQGTGIPWDYVLNAGFYGLSYLVAVLALGLLAFRTMDVR